MRSGHVSGCTPGARAAETGQSRQRRTLAQHCPSALRTVAGAASATPAAAGSPPAEASAASAPRSPLARARNVAIGITRHHGAWAAIAIVSGRELARTPCPGRVDSDTNVLFTGRGAGGSAGGMGCLPTLADSPAASIRTSPGPVAAPWSTAAAGWGTVGSNRTLLHTPPGNPAGPLALDARDSSPPTARSP